MSDLISRNELLKCFCINKNGQRIPEVDCDNIEVTVSIKDVKRIIREQPTAFDTKKVVEQLEKLKQHNKKLSEGAYLEDDKSFYFCAYTNFAKAIDIVKKGGVE